VVTETVLVKLCAFVLPTCSIRLIMNTLDRAKDLAVCASLLIAGASVHMLDLIALNKRYKERLEFLEKISRLISLTCPLSADPNITDLLQIEHHKF